MANPGIGDRIFGLVERIWDYLTGIPREPGDPPASNIARAIDYAIRDVRGTFTREEKERDTLWGSLPTDLTGEHFLDLLERAITDPEAEPLIYHFAKAMFLAFSMAGVAGPWARRGSYWVEQFAKSGRLDPGSAYLAMRRGDLSSDQLRSDLADQGFDDVRIDAMISAFKRYLDDDAAMTLWLRGDITEDMLEEHLAAKGYTAPSIVGLKKLARRIPGPTDLVRMAVREAWRDDVAARWGYDKDFVGQFQEWMEKQGMGGEWPKLYWRAHWELPSITLAREMLHRTTFSEDDFKTLLRIGDIPEGYRELITKVMYIPYTRVDVRRMYGEGVLDREQVYESYRDLGFDHEKATNMTEFSIRYTEGSDKEIAKGEILKGYNKGLMGYDLALSYLTRLGYREQNAQFLLAIEDLKIVQAYKDERLKTYKAQYVEGIWDDSELVAALGTLNLPDTEMRRYLELWVIERQRRVTRPTTAQLLGMFSDSVITEGTLREELDKKGLSDTYIGWYIDDIERDKSERLERESEVEKRRLLAQIRNPSKSELKVWWLSGIIGEPELRERMESVGYEADDIENYITQWEAEEEERLERESEAEIAERQRAKRHPTKVDLKVFLRLGYVTAEGMQAELELQGFEEYWAIRYVAAALEEMEAGV